MADGGVVPDDDLTATLATEEDAVGGVRRYLDQSSLPGPGATVGRYRIDALLGRGGEGIVLAAHDPLLERPVALKLLRPERRADRDRLLREGQAIARLRHPNVVTVYDVGEHGDDLFIAMELVRGDNLRTWLAAAPRTWQAGLAVVLAAGRGLAAAHAAGLVHGDFKPENILVAADGHVVVGDFGLARAGERTPSGSGLVGADDALMATATGPVHGTPAYLAPEQWRGRLSTVASDQFAFGVTLHEALFGVRPFDGGGDASFATLAAAVEAGRRVPLPAHRVPRRMVRALDRALALEPAARFPSLDALLAEVTPPRRRRWLVPTVTAVAAGGAMLAFTMARDATRVDPRLARCDRTAAQAAQAWTPTARQGYLDRHRDRPWAGEHAGWIDRFTAEWSQARRAVCLGEATLVATQPEAAAACLDRGLDALTAAAATAAATWPELPSTRDCLAPPVLRPQSRSLAFGPQGYPRLSPDGREVAVTHLSGDAYVTTLESTTRPRPVAGAWEILGWLDDGSMYVSRRDRRYERVAPDGTVTPIGTLPVFVPRGSQLSGDGAYAAFEHPHQLVIVEVATGVELGRVAGEAHQVAWEPSGRRVAVTLGAEAVAVFDVRTRRTVTLPMRTGVGTTGVRALSWLGDGEVAVSGELTGADRRVAVWSFHFTDDGALGAGPRLRLIPPPSTGYMPADHTGDRLAIETISLRQRTFLWRRGQAMEQHSRLDDADVVAVDPARGLALSRRDGELLLFPLDGSAPPTTIAATEGSYTFRGGVITRVDPGGAGSWSLVELADDGTTRVAARLRWDADDVALACDHATGTHCVLFGQRAGRLVVAPLVGDRLGAAVALPGLRGVPAVAADGRRWVAVRDRDSAAVEVDAASGRVVAEHVVTGADCYLFGAGWRAGAPGIWAKFACADRFGLVHGPIGGGYPTILDSNGWMSGVTAFGDEQYLYSVQDNDAHLLLVDGL